MERFRQRSGKRNNGFTLVEVMITIAVGLIIFTSLAAGIIGIQSLNVFVRHHMQATHTARGTVELLKSMTYDNVFTYTVPESYDAGPDLVFGTADDLTGTLNVVIQDVMDFDNDGNTAEADGINFLGNMAKPVRVTFTWNQRFLGISKNVSVTFDTVISR